MQGIRLEAEIMINNEDGPVGGRAEGEMEKRDYTPIRTFFIRVNPTFVHPRNENAKEDAMETWGW